MTEKVKITQEQGEAIERFLDSVDGDKERFLRMHVAGDGIVYWGDYCHPLNNLSIMKFAEILVNGYEVEPKFKIGDWVVHDSEQGAEVVREIRRSVIETNKRSHFYYRFRHATPEEIAERKEWELWDSIGREVGDFTEGDVGIFRNGMRVSDSGDLEKYYEYGDLIGFYPAESFVNFGDGDSNA